MTDYSFTGCVRGSFGTSAVSHSDNVSITQVIGYTLLNGAIDNSQTTITVDSTVEFLSTGTILIDSERITYTGITSTTFTGCGRGANGTTAASHVDNSVVTQVSSTTTLSDNPLTSSATTINVGSTNGFSSTGVILIDYEYITYTGTTGTSFTGCTRGQFLSNASSHTTGATVTQVRGLTQVNYTNPSYLNSTLTTIPVVSTSGFPSSGNIQINSEIINYTGTTSTTFTGCTRGYAGTTAVSHTNIAYVKQSLETATLQSFSANSTSIVLNDATGFSSSGGIVMIGTEQITYTGISTNTLTGCVRGVYGTTPISYSNGSSVYQGYITSLLSTNGYTQIQPELMSDVDGILYGYWYDTISETTILRNFTKPYYSSTNLINISAPVFCSYIKYVYFSYSTQTTFYLGVKFITKSISGQILGLTDFMPQNLVANLSRTILTGQEDNGNFKNVNVSGSGHLGVAINEPLNPFGSVHTENLEPVFQLDAIYGLNPLNMNAVYTGSGNTIASDSSFVTYSGTQIYSQATIQSRTKAKYRPGQGIVAFFTAIFPTGPVANSYQIAGLGTAEDGVYFGYVNTQFGILYTNRGLRRIQTLTITSNTAGTVNIVLNSATAVQVTLSSTTTTRSAYEIAVANYPGWDAQAIGNTVVFLSANAAVQGGTYSITGGTATISASFTTTRVGSASIEQFIPQSSWNIDTLDGSNSDNNPSGVLANWQTGNVFKIDIQYLGYGSLVFGVETVNASNSGGFVKVHSINLPNSLTTTSFRNPTFPYTQAVYSAGSTTNLVVKSGSISAFNEGIVKYTANKFTFFNSNTSTITTTTFATSVPIFSIQNGLVYNGVTNLSAIKLISISVAVRDGTNYNSTSGKVGATVFLIKNPTTLSGPTNFVAYSPESITYRDISSTSFTLNNNAGIIYSLSVAANSNEAISFSDDILLQPGDILTITAMSIGGGAGILTGDLQITLNTRENT